MNTSNLFRNSSENLTYLQQSIRNHIKTLPAGELHVYNRVKAGRTYTSFVHLTPDGKRHYINKQKDLLKKLSVKLFLETELSHLEDLICMTDAAVDASEHLKISSLLDEIPAEIREFLPLNSNDDSLIIDKKIDSEKMVSWKKQTFGANNFYKNTRKHRTSDGIFVKSKSELVIYEKLLQFGIVFKYEAPIQIGSITYYPDFTILLPDGRIYYWEHAGMMEIENYRTHHKKKLAAYESAGIVPWKNLIVTYDDENENLNIQIVESEIRNKLLV